MDPAERIRRLDDLLPQTQCRQCGYAGCRPYAEAIAAGHAGIDQCPPGGDAGARELARVMGVPARPVDPRFGACKSSAIAVIDEAACIGCTLCINACPVDAIVGAAKLMHTVVAANCTGCELCLAPCPVDCIQMVPAAANTSASERHLAAHRARVRYERRQARLQGKREAAAVSRLGADEKRLTLQRAIERARQRLARRDQAGAERIRKR